MQNNKFFDFLGIKCDLEGHVRSYDHEKSKFAVISKTLRDRAKWSEFSTLTWVNVCIVTNFEFF